MGWIERHAVRVSADGTSAAVVERLAVEAPLQISVNGLPFATTMRTPGADIELARGLLHTEAVVAEETVITWDTLTDPESGYAGRVHARVREEAVLGSIADRRALTAHAACGVCGVRRVEDALIYGPPVRLPERRPVAIYELAGMLAAMAARQSTFHASGGCHGAALASESGELLAVFEDVGRHNAVDKAIGALLNTQRLRDAAVLLVSGRVSYEIVAKAYRAAVPVVAAVSAASSMAIDDAERLGIAVVGFCRDGRGTVYSRPGRIAGGVLRPMDARGVTS